MARSKDLKVVITGDADKLNRELKRANGSLDKLGKQTRLTSSVTSRGFAGMRVAAVGATAALGGLAIAGKKVVDAAIESEKSQARLQAQLKASGLSYDAHAKQIETVIQKHSQLAGLDDEDLQDAFTNIVRVTGDVDKSLRLVGLASDFARGKQIDVAKAGEIVAKVAGGNIGVLGRYGIKVKEGATAQEALAQLQTKFAGQAEAYGKTTAGSVDRASVAFENLQETVGAAVAPAIEKAATAIATFVTQMQSGTGAGGRFADAVRKVGNDLRPVGEALLGVAKFTFDSRREILALATAFGAFKILTAVAAGFRAVRAGIIGLTIISKVVPAFWALNAAMTANPIGLVVVGLAALAGGLVYAYTKSKTFREVVSGAFTAVKKVVVEAVQGIIWIFDKWLGAFSTIATALSKVPLIGDKFKGVARQIDRAREKLRAFSKSLDDVPRIKDIKVNVRARISKNLRGLLDDENSISSRPPAGSSLRRQRGGIIPGTGTGDRVPLMGEPGEFVIQRRIVDRFGPTFFAALNEGKAPQFKTGGGIITRANKLDRMRIPYLYGGGHGTPDGFNKSGMDCSASVSYALGVSPRVSGQFMSFGKPGAGSPNDTKIYANPGHMFAVFNGRGWGTSRENPGGGPGWLSYNHRPGFTIRHLEDGSEKGSASTVGNPQETVESGKQRKRERAERSGSRAVNRIAAKFGKGLSAAVRGAAAVGQVVEQAEGGYGRSERFFGQVIGGQPGAFGDEDLSTVEGRAQRTSEVQELKKLKQQQLARLNKRKGLLKRAIGKASKQLSELRKARDKAKGAKRAKMSERIKAFDDRLVDLKAELAALGEQISDTTLDIGDLDKDLGELAQAPEAEAGPEPQSAVDFLGSRLAIVDAMERAGRLTPEQALAERKRHIEMALGGQFGSLGEVERYNLEGDLRELMAAQTQATNGLVQALLENTASNNALLAFGDRVSTVTSIEAVAALASMISGELGPRVAARQAMPGSGQLSRL